MGWQVSIGSVTFNGANDGNNTRLICKQVEGWALATVEQSWHQRMTNAGAVIGESRLGTQTVVTQGVAIGATATGAWQSHETIRSAASTAVGTDVTVTVAAPSGSQTLTGCRTVSFQTEWLTDRIWRWQWTLTSGTPR